MSLRTPDSHQIIQECGGDIHTAARRWYDAWERESLIVHRISRPWPEEKPTIDSRVRHLEDRVKALEYGQRRRATR